MKRSDRGMEFYLDLLESYRAMGIKVKVEALNVPTHWDRFSNLTLELATFGRI